MRFFYFFVHIVLLLMVSCSPATIPSAQPVSITPVAGEPEGTTNAYPAPSIEKIAPGYPAPAEPTVTPTPPIDPSLGIVKGELYLEGKPVGNALLFLSDVVKSNKGDDSVVSIDYNTKNRALTQMDGSFTFINIPQKRYALVLVVISNSFLLLNPKDQSSMLVDVVSGQTVNMGRLDYDALPIPPEQ